jgi:sec-independent protein translocase protein TatA
MFGLGPPELLIIGAIIILLFGVGKISGLGRELGSSIKEFRRAVKDEDAEKKQIPPTQHTEVQAPPPPPPPVQAQAPQPPSSQQSSGERKPNIF